MYRAQITQLRNRVQVSGVTNFPSLPREAFAFDDPIASFVVSIFATMAKSTMLLISSRLTAQDFETLEADII